MVRRLSVALSLLAAFLFCTSFASANSVEFLNFNYLQNGQLVQNFYNGGSGNAGVPNFGVTFSSNFYGLRSNAQGGSGNFSPDPTSMPVVFMSGTGSITGYLNAAGGFSSGVNFFYTAAFSETVTVWSGANGTGTVLASMTLAPNDTYCGLSGYCNWTNASLSFSGTAGSVTFSGPANAI